ERIGIGIDGQAIALVGVAVECAVSGVVEQEAVVFSERLAEVGDCSEYLVARGVPVEESRDLEAVFGAEKSGKGSSIVDCGLQSGQGRGIVVDPDDESVVVAGGQVAGVSQGICGETTVRRGCWFRVPRGLRWRSFGW